MHRGQSALLERSMDRSDFEQVEASDHESSQLARLFRTSLHVVSEVVWLLKEAAVLTWYMGFGLKWVSMSVRIVLYAIILAPGFARFVWWYITSNSMVRHIQYGPHNRSYLDILFPVPLDQIISGPKERRFPVVICVTGGAWIIGYNAWCAMLARFLAMDSQCIVVMPDYRNFPQADMSAMTDDVSSAIRWTFDSIARFGGDPERTVLLGQSAGAQLCMLSMMREALRARGQHVPPAYNPSRLRHFVGVSGVYDLVVLEPHMHARGLYNKVLHAIAGGKEYLERWSPTRVAERVQVSVLNALPSITLVHGDHDESAPLSQSGTLYSVIQSRESDHALFGLSMVVIRGGTHTSLIVEDPLLGKSMLVGTITSIIKDINEAARAGGEMSKADCSWSSVDATPTYALAPYGPQVSRTLARIARVVCPF